MSEQNIPEPAEALEGVRREAQELEAAIEQMTAAAARRWKVNAIVFGVIILVIASYLYFLVYRGVKDWLNLEYDVRTAIDVAHGHLLEFKDNFVQRLEDDSDYYVDTYLGKYIQDIAENLPAWRADLVANLNTNVEANLAQLDPFLEQLVTEIPRRADEAIERLVAQSDTFGTELESRLDQARAKIPRWCREASKQLVAQAPDIVDKHVVPWLEGFQAQIPAKRDELIEDLKEKAPEAMDWLYEQITTQGLPRVRSLARDAVDKAADDMMEQVTDTLDEAVDQVVADSKEFVDVLREQDLHRLTQALEESFEAHLGPQMDEAFELIEAGLVDFRDRFAEMIEARRAGTPLTQEQKVEWKAIQLVRTLLIRKLSEYEAGPLTGVSPRTPSKPAVPAEEVEAIRKKIEEELKEKE